MSQQQYFANSEKDEMELSRLRMQEATLDPRTILLFEMLRVAEGWHCLEVGAGSGSMAEWLGRQVGPKGKVVAADINTRFLRLLSTSNIEIRQHDISKDELETNCYDLVHCRNLLMHLTAFHESFKRMGDAVRPGGWLLVEEVDFGSVAADMTHHSAVLFNTVIPKAYGAMSQVSTLDAYFGRRVPGLMNTLAFIDMGHRGSNYVCQGGDTQPTAHAATIRILSEKLISVGVMTLEQHDEIQRIYQDPTFSYMGPTMIAAWGRKPT